VIGIIAFAAEVRCVRIVCSRRIAGWGVQDRVLEQHQTYRPTEECRG
jgi:hypothetical protein